MGLRNFLIVSVLAVGLMVSVAAPVLAAEMACRLVFYIDENDQNRMNLVLNNAQNVNSHCEKSVENGLPS